MSEVTKVNISSADAQQPQKTDNVYKVDLKEINEKAEVQPEEAEQPAEEQAASEGTTPVLEEVLEEVTEAENASKPVEEPEPKGRELPEGVEKLLSFMEETGGTLEDYSKLNKDQLNLLQNQSIIISGYLI